MGFDGDRARQSQKKDGKNGGGELHVGWCGVEELSTVRIKGNAATTHFDAIYRL